MKKTSCNGVLVIPCFNPKEGFVELAEQMSCYFYDLIIVDDGSFEENKKIFDRIKESLGERCHLLSHDYNSGKGQALKTAISYYLNSALKDKYNGIVSADCDGQHIYEDVVMIDGKLKADERALIIGHRDLKSEEMPLRSKFGNRLTAFAFNFFYAVKMKDTQSGLRGYPNAVLDWLLTVKGERFEYEMNMLILSRSAGVKISEYPITTKYEKNHTSTYRTLKDSVKVAKVLFSGIRKFMISAIVGAVVNYLVFCGVYYIVLPRNLRRSISLFVAIISSRGCGGVVNYTINRVVTFGARMNDGLCAAKYCCVRLLEICISYLAILGLTSLFAGWEFLLKILVEWSIAPFVYQAELRWVFRGNIIDEEQK